MPKEVASRPSDEVRGAAPLPLMSLMVKGCHCGYVGSTSGVAQIADDPSRRSTRQPWTLSGLLHRSEQRCYLITSSAVAGTVVGAVTPAVSAVSPGQSPEALSRDG